MKCLIVGVGDLQVSRAYIAADARSFSGSIKAESSSVTLITYALGSCISVSVFDPVAQVGGLLHYMLPDSTLDPARAEERPAMFADVGIPMLFRSCYKLGAEKKRMQVYGAGGAQVSGACDPFAIGKRNQLALKKILWKAGVILRGESLGGSLSRTVRLDLATGRVCLSIGAEADQCVYDPRTLRVEPKTTGPPLLSRPVAVVPGIAGAAVTKQAGR